MTILTILEQMPYVFALFEGEEGTEGEQGGESTATGTKQEVGTQQTQTRTQTRSQARVTIPDTTDVNELRRMAEEAAERATSAEKRISDLNKENEQQRKTFKGRLDAGDQRVIRLEAREALNEAGAIHPRIVDLFLADNKDAVKIDPATGEPIGIRENIATWKEKNSPFFKVAADAGTSDQGKTDAEKAAEAAALEADKKPNATGKGASPAGAGTGGKDNGGLRDLREISDPKERGAAYRAWKNTLRRN